MAFQILSYLGKLRTKTKTEIMLRFITLLTVLALCSLAAFGRSHHHNNNNNNNSHGHGHSSACSKNYHFDYILLAVQWPETFCEQQACIKHKDQWQIHGAWPENNDGSYPQDCCAEKLFDMKSMSPELVKRMIAVWGTLKAHGSNEEFWSHEFNKHGTCSIESPKLKNQNDYFTNTLNLFETKIKIQDWFAAANITPSATKTYKMSDIHAAIQKGYGHSVQVQCTNSRRHHEQVFQQINFCINKETLEPMDCPQAAHDRNCKAETIAYLPTEGN